MSASKEAEQPNHQIRLNPVNNNQQVRKKKMKIIYDEKQVEIAYKSSIIQPVSPQVLDLRWGLEQTLQPVDRNSSYTKSSQIPIQPQKPIENRSSTKRFCPCCLLF